MAAVSLSRAAALALAFGVVVLGASSRLHAQSGMSSAAPSPDPRVGLRAGQYDAAEATWNMRVVSRTKPSEKFVTSTNSDLSFTGKYAIQGSYNGYQIWDI